MTSGRVRPAWWSLTVTRAAAHVVPPGRARERWESELVSELYGLSVRQQARHTLGVLLRAPSLRSAVTDPDRIIEEDIMRKPIRCRLHLHRFRMTSTADGTRFLRCSRCGKDDDSLGRGHWAGSLGAGSS